MTILRAHRIILRCTVFIIARYLQLAYQTICRNPFLYTTFFTFIIAIYAAVIIGSARAERDSACQKAAHLQTQVEQLSCALEALKHNR